MKQFAYFRSLPKLHNVRFGVIHFRNFSIKSRLVSEEDCISVLSVKKKNNEKLSQIYEAFSEKGLIKARLIVEVEWLKSIVSYVLKDHGVQNKEKVTGLLDKLVSNFSLESAEKVKEIEKVTNHDVKAIEYFIKNEMTKYNIPKTLFEFTHFCCTSEDINNVSWSLILKDTLNQIYLPGLSHIIFQLTSKSKEYADQTMLCRTHGQPATPSTFGKELANFTFRINEITFKIRNLKLRAKMNGAVGNYNAHYIVIPNFNWALHSKVFLERLGFEYNPYTTQIENHDSICELFNYVSQLNTIIIDLVRDLYGYNSLNYFVNEEDGKILSEIEANLQLSNSLLQFFSSKLPISRFQRDLSDSTVMRNIGLGLSHSTLAIETLSKFVESIKLNSELLYNELDNHWELMAEPLQTVMRYHGFSDPYEILKEHTRGKHFGKNEYLNLVNSLTNLPDEVKQKLLELTPHNYIGNANQMASELKDYIR